MRSITIECPVFNVTSILDRYIFSHIRPECLKGEREKILPKAIKQQKEMQPSDPKRANRCLKQKLELFAFDCKQREYRCVEVNDFQIKLDNSKHKNKKKTRSKPLT